MGWPAAGLVLKSDTSLLLLRTLGATQLAFAASFLARAYAAGDHSLGWSLLLFHTAQIALLGYCIAAGGQRARLLWPFILHNATAIAGLGASVESPGWKFLQRLKSGRLVPA